MTPEQILAIEPKVLKQEQREAYFRDGFLFLPKAINEEWIQKLRKATDEMVERSRKVTRSDPIFDLEPAHRPDAPRLRRVSNPVEHHPVYWDYCLNSVMPDIVSDLVGPDVKFHHSKLNFKWANGGEEVKWHYDISFYPHTNYSPLTIGTYLYDCGMDQGPLAALPGSHNIEPMPSQYNAKGEWTGCLSDEDVAKLDTSKMVYMPGPAGSLTIHNCRTLHYSAKNDSDLGRPLLLIAMTSADAFPYTVNPIKPKHDQYLLRGKRAQFAHHDPRPCLLPPDWSKGYTSIFTQQNEGEKELIAR
ncbi:MAG TPA: phytanoyl-CoA dioxygenase family protein [Burkholderiales bacterium]|jgi:ectoine hydroxylase-related dioxygenase (phytanoyl-CoA dioxygenase family)|nr:phytanoyl-CoA dioxygenase family protein [Burkholderiales bacterium]